MCGAQVLLLVDVVTDSIDLLGQLVCLWDPLHACGIRYALVGSVGVIERMARDCTACQIWKGSYHGQGLHSVPNMEGQLSWRGMAQRAKYGRAAVMARDCTVCQIWKGSCHG